MNHSTLQEPAIQTLAQQLVPHLPETVPQAEAARLIRELSANYDRGIQLLAGMGKNTDAVLTQQLIWRGINGPMRLQAEEVKQLAGLLGTLVQ